MHKCILEAQWAGSSFVCSKCGKELAFRYRIGEEVRIFVHERFKKFAQEIKERKGSYEVSSWRDLLGDISFSDFEDLLHDFRCKPFDILPLPECGGWDAEDSEGYDSDGFSDLEDLDDIFDPANLIDT